MNTNRLIRVLPWTCAAVLAIATYLSFRTRDSHWIGRGGAVVAALAAGAGYFQIKIEQALEEERQRIQRVDGPDTHVPARSIVDDVALKIVEKRRELDQSRLVRRRLAIVACVVGCAFIGEVVHGIGDVMLDAIFPGVFNHAISLSY